jgi:hypothetical protein
MIKCTDIMLDTVHCVRRMYDVHNVSKVDSISVQVIVRRLTIKLAN